MDLVDCLYITRELRHGREIRLTDFLYRIYESAILHIQPVLIATFQRPLCNGYSGVNFSTESIQRVPVGAYRILRCIAHRDISVKGRAIHAGMFIERGNPELRTA